MKKTSKLVSLRPDFNRWPRISLNIFNMTTNFPIKIFHAVFQPRNHMLLLKNFQKFLALIEFDQILNTLIDAALKAFELIQSLVSEVLGRRLILLDALQIADDLFGAQLLLIDDTLKVIKLLVHFFVNFVLQFLLASDSFLHFLAFFQIVSALFLNIFQMLKMHVRCLL